MRKNIKYVNSVEEFNEVLAEAHKYTNVMKCTYEVLRWEKHYSLATHSCLEDNMVECRITTQYYKCIERKKFYPCTYIFRKDGKEDCSIEGTQAYMTTQRLYKVDDARQNKEIRKYLGYNYEEDKYSNSASPLVGFSPKFDNTEHNVYVYDLNSAYGAQLINKIPDVNHYKLYHAVGENQVGFLFDQQLTLVESGFADIVFDLIDSPYREYVFRHYKAKQTATDKFDKAKHKAMLNYPIGYWQRTSPFLRAYVIHKCNKFIESRLDEHSCMWNTDAIYSTVPRPDLKIGDGLGEFKLEYVGKFRQKGLNYQKVDIEEVSWRGTPKSWFGKDFNILTDKRPTSGNRYRLNVKQLRIEEIDNV
jgi:hypothetical protein